MADTSSSTKVTELFEATIVDGNSTTNSPSSNDMNNVSKEDELRRRLDNLPRELHDMIQDFTFIAHKALVGPKVCEIQDPASRADYFADLKILQLNSSTRERYAVDFYCLRTFSSRKFDLKRLEKCLRSIPEAYRAFVSSIICHCPDYGLIAQQAGWRPR
ncbi:uncharacterized protein RCC_04490 [Ramularia collo-cygni]|uniref:Uncharacterized protein n=1 Tax=Ramularia collo-cygni TaxID=112498 RepID=A0A2D3V531_9PEZI|nr:uncharacterized protein RCC_04490 [Ramularia collo-cygni]CZT18646.1 uncharacterized protein RCC_04490 [Ramularia collo-cygni]